MDKAHGRTSEPQWKSSYLKDKLGKGRLIFVGDAGDMWGPWVKPEWIQQVLEHCKQFDNTYWFLTKFPDRFQEFLNDFPKKSIVGATIETNRYHPAISSAPPPKERYQNLLAFKELNRKRKHPVQIMVSMEPLMDFCFDEYISWLNELKPDFVYLGLDSKIRATDLSKRKARLPEPSLEKMQTLHAALRSITNFYLKDNISAVLKTERGYHAVTTGKQEDVVKKYAMNFRADFTWNMAEKKKILRALLSAINKNSNKEALRGIYLSVKDGLLTLATTNGERIVEYKEPITSTREIKCIIPYYFVESLVGATFNEDDISDLRITNTKILSRKQNDSAFYQAELINLEFPAYTKYLDTFNYQIRLSKKELLKIVNQVNPELDQKDNNRLCIRFMLNNKIKIYWNEFHRECDYKGGVFKKLFHVDGKLLKKSLSALEGNDLVLKWFESEMADYFIFETPDNDSVRTLLVTLKLGVEQIGEERSVEKKAEELREKTGNNVVCKLDKLGRLYVPADVLSDQKGFARIHGFHPLLGEGRLVLETVWKDSDISRYDHVASFKPIKMKNGEESTRGFIILGRKFLRGKVPDYDVLKFCIEFKLDAEASSLPEKIVLHTEDESINMIDSSEEDPPVDGIKFMDLTDYSFSKTTEGKVETDSPENEIVVKQKPDFRPQTLEEFTHQQGVLNCIIPNIKYCKKTNEIFPHTLLHGPPGLGKTSIANLIARELKRDFIRYTGGNITTVDDVIKKILSEITPGCIVFIDEIHGMKRKAEDFLCPILEVVERGHPYESADIGHVSPFTLIGATTDKGLLDSRAFLDRFREDMRVGLDFYEVDSLYFIFKKLVERNRIPIDDTAIREIAKRSCGTPRTATQLLEAMRSSLEFLEEGKISIQAAQKYFDRVGIDDEGLGPYSRKVIRILYEREGKPIGLKGLAQVSGIGSEETVVMLEYWLRSARYIDVEPKGRVLTEKGKEYYSRSVEYEAKRQMRLKKEEEKSKKAVGAKHAPVETRVPTPLDFEKLEHSARFEEERGLQCSTKGSSPVTKPQSAKTQTKTTYHTWIDYTRKTDPACPAGVKRIGVRINDLYFHEKPFPDVVCFWTKNPAGLAKMYQSLITGMKEQGVVVLAQVTINPGYQPLLEPGIKREFWRLDELAELLGSPRHIRARFDPYIPGFTSLEMFERHCDLVSGYGIVRTVTNFVVKKYKDVRAVLKSLGIDGPKLSQQEEVEILAKMIEIAGKYGLELQACAEINQYPELVPGLLSPACSDAEWPKSLGHDLKFKARPSRRGCGCCYSDDWGLYKNETGGWACPHQCVYCYAK